MRKKAGTPWRNQRRPNEPVLLVPLIQQPRFTKIQTQTKGKFKMKAFLKIIPLLGSAALVIAFSSGCALSKDYVRIGYIPQANVSRINGAEAVAVGVEVIDSRTITDKVSVKKNGYGMEMAPIIATNDVPSLLKTALESELANRGFNCGGKRVSVVAGLTKFYSDFKVGFWSGSAVAELTMEIKVKRADGTIAFSSLVVGEGVNPKLQLASGDNARVALEAALQNGLQKLFNDSAFIDSLLKSGQRQAESRASN
jgi:uncharacterized lipoprotein